MRKLLLIAFVILANLAFAQVPSPKQFLGYELGDRYTPHYKIVNYFKAVAAANPSMMKLEQYGQTYEGRPLMVAYVAIPANLNTL